MAVIQNPSFKLNIELDDESPHYTITEPYSVSHVIFFLEAARFIRETAANYSATIKTADGRTLEFDRCGLRMNDAYSTIYDAFIKGKGDWYLSSVAKVEIDDDDHLLVTIDPSKTAGDETSKGMHPLHLTIEHINYISRYTGLYGQHQYLPEFLQVLGASDDTVNRVRNSTTQLKVTSLPVRFAHVDGRRITLLRHNVTGQPGIRFG
ncbi:MAG: hypothetical protein SFW65_09995 [Alphaproteobacteria bacterium]|nr:hypothetical protein [Alphaproteobacteria bacterium]